MRTLAARFAALAACSGAVAACSLLLNTKADQCASDRDCATFKHANTCVQGICVSTGGDGATVDGGDDDASDAQGDVPIIPTTCNLNADCANPNTVCQTSTHTCISLTSAECPEVLGDYKNDNAIIFGAILPTAISQAPDYLAGLQDTGTSMKDGLSLAVDDFASAKNPGKGIPPQPGKTDPRPMVFVVCSDNESQASTAAATTHLVSALGVPAIVGTAFSTYTRAIVSTLASLNKTDVLLMTPRSSDLVPADNGGVFTRLAPTDAAQGAAIAALYANREPGLLAQVDAGSSNLKVVLAYKEDAYGNGVASAIKTNLVMRGAPAVGNPSFHEFKYGNPDSANYSSQFASTTLGIVNVRPHVIIFVGTNEIVPGILSQVEANWAESNYRPHYFMSDGTVTKELWEFLATHDTSDTIRKRIVGTIPMGTPDRYAAFAAAYSAKYAQQNAIVYGAAGLYDAAYMLAYGTASIGSKPVTGPNIIDGFGLLAQGGGALVVGVGPDDITATFAKMQSGQPVNLDGASSGLDIDSASRTVSNVTTQVWCIPSAGGQAQPAILSGQSIDPSNAVQGTVSAACGQ